jgi:hypothetical protein
MSAWLAAAYAVLALAFGWAIATGRGHWWSRLPFIVCAPALAIALWQAHLVPAGWPTTRHVPAQAGFLWADVHEPDPLHADPGHIYLWLDVGGPRPRAFTLPYSRRLHEQVEQAMRRVRRGLPVAVSRPRPRAGGPRGHAGAHGPPAGVLRFYPHPPAFLPGKPGVIRVTELPSPR